MLSPADLQREAEATGLRAEALEKAFRLLELLEGFRSHPFLKSRVALEMEFLDHLDDRGDIVPELLTTHPKMLEILRGHPGLRWKALNVRRHRGLEGEW